MPTGNRSELWQQRGMLALMTPTGRNTVLPKQPFFAFPSSFFKFGNSTVGGEERETTKFGDDYGIYFQK